jgi:hypothetical protein
MQLAAGSAGALCNTVLRGSPVVYTSKDATDESASLEADNTSQDSLNAAV